MLHVVGRAIGAVDGQRLLKVPPRPIIPQAVMLRVPGSRSGGQLLCRGRVAGEREDGTHDVDGDHPDAAPLVCERGEDRREEKVDPDLQEEEVGRQPGREPNYGIIISTVTRATPSFCSRRQQLRAVAHCTRAVKIGARATPEDTCGLRERKEEQ